MTEHNRERESNNNKKNGNGKEEGESEIGGKSERVEGEPGLKRGRGRCEVQGGGGYGWHKQVGGREEGRSEKER